jgi:hypothetical protein
MHVRPVRASPAGGWVGGWMGTQPFLTTPSHPTNSRRFLEGNKAFVQSSQRRPLARRFSGRRPTVKRVGRLRGRQDGHQPNLADEHRFSMVLTKSVSSWSELASLRRASHVLIRSRLRFHQLPQRQSNLSSWSKTSCFCC